MKPEKTSKSCAWGADCFSLIYNNNVKENYVYCEMCYNLITYNSVHGTGSLLRHHCYKKVMNSKKDDSNAVKVLNFASSPKIQKKVRSDDGSDPLSDMLANSPDPKFQLKHRDNTKQKKEIEEKIARGDQSFDMRAPENIKSEVWSNGNFKILYQNGVKLDFVMCLLCHSLITYKSKTGTASLLRHSCIKRMNESVKREYRSEENLHEFVSLPLSEADHTDDAEVTQTISAADNLSYINENDNDNEHEHENDADQEPFSTNELPDELKEEAIKLFHYFSFKDMQPTNLAYKKGFLSFGQYLINVGAAYKRVNIETLFEKQSASASLADKSMCTLQKMLKPKFEDHKIALSCDYWTDVNRKLNFFTLYGHYINDSFQLKKVNLGTVNFVEEFSTIDYKQLVVSMLESYFASEADIETFLLKTTTVLFDEMLDCFKSYSSISCSCLTLNRIVLQLIDECGLRASLPNEVHATENWLNIWEYLEVDDDSIDAATAEECKRILDPFTKAVKSLSSDQKPTINEVYIFRKKIEDYFLNTRFSNAKVRDVALNIIRENFPITNLHKVAVFLDPRFKSLKFMSHEEKTAVINMVTKMVCTDESEGNSMLDIDSKSTATTTKSNTLGDHADSSKYLIEYMDIDDEQDDTHDEVDIYVNLKFNDVYSANILEFWESRYDLPQLRQLAREILCIPASGIVAEKLFSEEANVLAKRRLNMEIDNIKQMLHIHENFEMLMNVF